MTKAVKEAKQIDWGPATVDALRRHTAREGSMLSPRVRDALRIALETHELNDKQKRKGKDVPYITHPPADNAGRHRRNSRRRGTDGRSPEVARQTSRWRKGQRPSDPWPWRVARPPRRLFGCVAGGRARPAADRQRLAMELKIEACPYRKHPPRWHDG